MEIADLIDASAARLGIQDYWYDYRGERHEVSRESKQALLLAMGVPADEPEALAQYLEQARLADWYGVLPPVVVLREQRDGGIPITVRREHAGFEVDWRIHTETGSILAGSFRPDELMWLDEAVVEGVLHQRYGFRPACALPLGYHRFELIGRQHVGCDRARAQTRRSACNQRD